MKSYLKEISDDEIVNSFLQEYQILSESNAQRIRDYKQTEARREIKSSSYNIRIKKAEKELKDLGVSDEDVRTEIDELRRRLDEKLRDEFDSIQEFRINSVELVNAKLYSIYRVLSLLRPNSIILTKESMEEMIEKASRKYESNGE